MTCQVTLANNAVTSYSYDSEGKKTSQTDALGRTTSWNYRATGELQSETLPLGQVESYTYDAYGKQTQMSDYAGKTQKFIYDAYDKLVRIEYADGSTVSYDYTPSGRLKTLTDAQGTIINTYDARGRLKSQTNPNNETITYTYDGVGNIIEVQTPTQTITKSYDALNRLKTVTDAKGTTTYEYDVLGRQTTITYPNGAITNYEYNSRNWVTKVEHKDSTSTVLQSFTYTLDNVGNRTQIVENTGRTTDYAYNTVHQLVSESITNDPKGLNTVTTYSYDLVGNLLTKTVDGVDTAYTYNDNDQLTEQGTITFTYDANGNLIAKDDTTYSYDDKNRLIEVTTPTQNITYSYDANDNRVAKTTTAGTTTYLIDANTPYAQVITESKDNGTQIEYTYGNDLISNDTSYFLNDALGSTRGLLDQTEQLTDTYSYTPYGELKEHSGSSENNFLYTGEQFDPETEDYYLRARYYSPQQQRFTSIDPFKGRMFEPITLNDYIYAGNNPVIYVDPNGDFFSMGGFSIGSVLSSMNTLSNAYTIASIGIDIAGGNYAGAAKDIMDEVVSSNLGRIRAVGNLGSRGVSMFASLFGGGKIPKLNLSSAHSSQVLAKNMKEFGFGGNASAAHHIIGSGTKSKSARNILARANININSPSNGVFLPNTKTWRTSPASPHIGGHNDAYWNLVNETLGKAVRGKKAGTDAYKWAVIDAISEIRTKLLTGQISLNKHQPFN